MTVAKPDKVTVADHRGDGSPVCWGIMGNFNASSWPLEEERFVAIASSDFHSCGFKGRQVPLLLGGAASGVTSLGSRPPGANRHLVDIAAGMRSGRGGLIQC